MFTPASLSSASDCKQRRSDNLCADAMPDSFHGHLDFDTLTCGLAKSRVSVADAISLFKTGSHAVDVGFFQFAGHYPKSAPPPAKAIAKQPARDPLVY